MKDEHDFYTRDLFSVEGESIKVRNRLILRRRTVIWLIARGYRLYQIAEMLPAADKTVRDDMKNLDVDIYIVKRMLERADTGMMTSDEKAEIVCAELGLVL
jgi:ATP/maltotriose-dependent transcriptional regulator MalT